MLGRLIAHQVEMVAQFILVTGTDSGFGLLGRSEPRPTYYVYQLYKHFGTRLIVSRSDDAEVSITAALRNDGMLTLMIVNLADVEKRMPLHGVSGSPEQIFLFDQQHTANEISVDEIVEYTNEAHYLTLPLQSITLIIFSAPDVVARPPNSL